jgi:hypothetical protein
MAVNVLNEQLRTAEKDWGLGEKLENAERKNIHFTKYCNEC